MKFCIKCRSPMDIRQSGKTYFWMCGDFPTCRHMEIIHDHEKVAIDVFKKSLVNRMQNGRSQEYCRRPPTVSVRERFFLARYDGVVA
ncbi:MAG: hypothetical protein DDT29_00035 [Dehalococcoidia bacterium]|nr:hypothetical protein [Bacillota bacterium]